MKDYVRKICVAQISIWPGEVEDNLKKIVDVIRRFRKNDLIVFPELVVQGHVYSTLPREEIAQIISITPSMEKVQQAARKHKVRVILGSMDEEEGRFYNVAVYLGRKTIQKYTKTHVHWTEHFDAGAELKTFDTALDKIGPLICYDAAFFEASRTLALQGARILTVLGAVPKAFDAQIMARRMQSIAVMNQVFVVYANRGGISFNGGSGVWGPRGDEVARVGQGEHFLEVSIDLRDVDQWREEEPLYPHRRADLYSVISDPQTVPLRPNVAERDGQAGRSTTRRRTRRTKARQ